MTRTALFLASLTLAACATTAPATPEPDAPTAAATPGVITGTLAYRARIALPPDATAEVRLVDGAGGMIARDTFATRGRQVPLPFTVRYRPEAIQVGVGYDLYADIRDAAGRVLWAAGPQMVLDVGPEPAPVELVMTQPAPTDVVALAGVRWRLVGFVRDGEATMLPPGEELTLTVGADGSYTGRGGCQPFGGSAGAADGPLTFGEARSTMMACPEPTAAPAFLAALGGAHVEAVRGATMTLAARDGARLTFQNGLDAWDEARALGVALRAAGQEPGWTLDVAPGREIVFLTDYGQRRVAAPDPREQTAGGRTVHTATSDAGALHVVVTETPCADAMSGAPYPLAVTVTLGNETVSGCGRRLD